MKNFGGWIIVRLGEAGPNAEFHTLPVNDDKEHESNAGCWCHPVADDQIKHYIHRSKDGREEYETGVRKTH